jgi:hypothetical protein
MLRETSKVEERLERSAEVASAIAEERLRYASDATPGFPTQTYRYHVQLLWQGRQALIREFVVELFPMKGSTLSTPRPAKRHWHCAGEVPPVLITDAQLPGSVDGWQIAERCREQDPG